MIETVIVGRIGQDPEIKYFESGKVKTYFSLAVSRWDFKTKEEVTDWFSVSVWDKLAESVGEHFKKGKAVVVQGELKQNNYKNSQGEEKTKWEITASSVKYSNAFIAFNGEVERIEERFKPDGKKIQYIKLKDCDIAIQNFKEIEFSKGDFLTCLCTLAMVDNKPMATAVKIDVSGSENKPIVKFAQEEFSDELIGEDEIPF